MRIKYGKHYQRDNRSAIIILLVILLCSYIVFLPMQTMCATEKIYSISEELNNSVVDELDKIDFSAFNDVIDEFNQSNSNIFAIDNVKNKVYSIISGESAVEYDNLFASIFSGIVEVILKYLPVLSILIGIGVVSNLLNGFKSKFNEKSTSNLINLVCFFASVTLVVGIVQSLMASTGDAIDSMVKQINILFPILLTLTIALGGSASAGAYRPIVSIITTYVADFFNFFILPLFLLSFVFNIISNMSDNVKLDKFCAFVSSLFKWSVGLIFTIFFAVFSLQGIAVGSFDSLSIRTTKYAIKSYVPIMGGYLSDGMDIIMSSVVLIKNSVGLVGVLMVISTIISPLLNIIVFSLMLKLVSAVLQPLGNSKTSNFLSGISKSITMLSSVIIAIGFMYLISIGLVMTTANVVM